MNIQLNISPALRAALGRTRDYVEAVGPMLAQEAISKACEDLSVEINETAGVATRAYYESLGGEERMQ